MRKSETKNNSHTPANARRAKNLIDSIRTSFKFSRAVPMMFLAIFSFSFFTALFSAPLAQATISLDTNMEACIANKGTWQSDNSSSWCSKAPASWNPALRAEAWAVTNAFVRCVQNSDGHLANFNFGGRISEDNMRSGQWFESNTTFNAIDGAPHKVAASYLIDNVGERGEVLCNAVIKEAAELAGYGTDYRAFYCAAVPVRADGTSCSGNGGGDYSGNNKASGKLSDYANEFYDLIKRKAFRALDPPLGGDALYILNLSSFQHSQGCHASPTTTPGNNANKTYRDIKILNAAGTGFDLKTFEGEDKNHTRWQYTLANRNAVEITCQKVAEAINANADAFLAWAKRNPEEAKNAVAVASKENDQAGVGSDKPTCGIDGIGWIVCPTLGFLATVTDRAFDFLATSFLAVDTKLLDTSTATYRAWEIMRNFANVAFVIAFLVIVYSQLTSAGVSNYGIKKMLPRLIVAAVLVNASYIICQLAVDLSNILGYTLKGLFDGLGNSMYTTSSDVSKMGDTEDATGNGFGVAGIITILTAGAITLAFALSFPVLIATLIALLVIILILLARKAIIILLIIVAPLAFVAYLLPNTENLFKKWQKMFTTLLLVFPVIALLFGSATLAAGLIKATNPGDMMTQLIAVGVAAMPLFLVPALLKGSVAAVGAIGTKMNGWGDKAQGKVGTRVGDTSRLGQFNKYRKSESERRRALIQAGAFKGDTKNPLNWGRNATSGVNKAFNASKLSGKFGDRSAASGISIADKIEDEEVGSAVKQITREGIAAPVKTEDYLAEKLKKAIHSGDTIGTRAAYTALTEQGLGGIAKIQSTMSDPATLSALNSDTTNSNSLREHITTKHPDVKTKDNRIMAWAGGDPSGLSSVNHLGSLTDTQIGSQTPQSLLESDPTSFSAADAARVLKDKNVQPNLKPKQREVLEWIKAGRAGTRPTP